MGKKRSTGFRKRANEYRRLAAEAEAKAKGKAEASAEEEE